MTTQTAGPAQSWNLRIVSIPLRSRSNWSVHMRRKAIQPSVDSPRKLFVVRLARSGQIRNAMMMTAREASHVCMPYHAIATIARIRAGTFAPNTPNESRANTGYGTPSFWPA